VKGEIAAAAREAGCQNVSDDDIIELLESHSLFAINK
jgi:hypothetical protein